MILQTDRGFLKILGGGSPVKFDTTISLAHYLGTVLSRVLCNLVRFDLAWFRFAPIRDRLHVVGIMIGCTVASIMSFNNERLFPLPLLFPPSLSLSFSLTFSLSLWSMMKTILTRNRFYERHYKTKLVLYELIITAWFITLSSFKR